MFKSLYLTCVLTAGAAALSAQVSTVLPVVRTTGMVGIGDAQTAKLNVLNPGVVILGYAEKIPSALPTTTP